MAYIGQGIKEGTFAVLDTSGNTYNGSTTTFSLGTQVGAAAQLLVSHDGVIQKPGTDYTLASGGASITFSTAPASGASIFIVEISGAVGGTVTPSDNSVGITQLNVSDGSSGQALTTNGSGTLSFASVGLAGIDDQTSSNDDQVTITDTAVVINEDSDDLDFRVETNGNANMMFISGGNDVVGIGNEGDLGVGLHIKSADSGQSSVSGSADEMIIEGSGDSGMTILSGASNTGNIFFGDSGDDNESRISYSHSGQDLTFFTAGTEDLRTDNQKISTGAEDAADVDAGGITIDNNANDGFSLTFKNSDVAHATTNEAQADTFMRMAKYTDDGGGAIVGYSENLTGIYIQGHTANPDTSKGGSSGSSIILKASKNSGSGFGNHASNENLATIANHNNPKFIFDADGDLHSDSSNTTFDAYEDAHLVRAFDLSHGRGVIDSKFDKFIAYNHEKLAQLQLVGREEDGTPNHFINVMGMQRLHNGAIWQQYEKHNQLLEAVYDLAKEAVGEEKANSILEKNEVKRLQ